MRPRVGMVMVGAFAAVAAITAERQPARACSCGVTEHIIPERGATDVPRNAVVTIAPFTGGSFSEALFLRHQGSQQRVETELATIKISSDMVLVTLAPATLLEAGATYELVHAWDMRTISEFSVGDWIAKEPHTAPLLESIAVEAMPLQDASVHNSCIDTVMGVFGRVRLLGGAVSENAEYSILTIGPRGEAPYAIQLMDERFSELSLVLPSGACVQRLPAIVPGTPYCATLTTYDITGSAKSSPEVCAVAVECALDVSDNGVPADTCAPVTDAAGCAIAVGGRGSGALALMLAAFTLLALTFRAVRRRM